MATCFNTNPSFGGLFDDFNKKSKTARARAKHVVSSFSATLPAIKTRMVTLPEFNSHSDDGANFALRFDPTISNFGPSYLGVFDQFRVMKMTFHYLPQFSQCGVGSAFNGACPFTVAAPEFDGTDLPGDTLTGMQAMLVKPNHIVTTGLVPFDLTFVPRLWRTIGNTTDQETAMSNTIWCPTSDTTIVLHGVKLWQRNPNVSTATSGFLSWLSIDVEFRGQHLANPGIVLPMPKPEVIPPDASKRQEKSQPNALTGVEVSALRKLCSIQLVE